LGYLPGRSGTGKRQFPFLARVTAGKYSPSLRRFSRDLDTHNRRRISVLPLGLPRTREATMSVVASWELILAVIVISQLVGLGIIHLIERRP
jgi:hypothetical protein